MEAFARFLIAEGEDPRTCGVGVLVCTGETLQPTQREFLARSYAARVVNEYGCTEAGVIAFPCPEQGRLHLSADNLVIEVLAGSRPAQPGEAGEVVLTELYSAGAPLIRYRLGDVVVADEPRPCPCGRGLPTLARIEGRTSEMIQLSDGRLVHSEAFAYLADAFGTRHPAIQSFRVRQLTGDSFRLELVAADALSAEVLESIAALTRDFLTGVPLEVRQVGQLERDPGGKLRYFVRDRERTP
jgi:phenylacetate-CoA ligase